MGYDITDGDGIIMAWRGPFLIQDPADGRWHMLFSAKSKDSCGVIRPTVGHAVADDGSFTFQLHKFRLESGFEPVIQGMNRLTRHVSGLHRQ